jgi:serine protease Do
MRNISLRHILTVFVLSAMVISAFVVGAISDRFFQLAPVSSVVDEVMSRPNLVWLQKLISQPQGTTSLDVLVPAGTYSVADVAQVVSPSVVTVSIKQVRPEYEFVPGGWWFGGMQRRIGEMEVQNDIGTGFVVDNSGLVVTNKHVVMNDSGTYSVIDAENREYEVSKIYRDPAIDLAILKVVGLKTTPVQLGDSDLLRVGEPVIAIGTALGEFRHTVTTGVISGLGRGIAAGNGRVSFETLDNVIQTDAAINPGNSGGPLINAAGQVIGVNVATAMADNISFAIPINVIKSALQNFNQTGQFERPFLGIRHQVVTEQAAIANQVPQGAYVYEVVTDSPAAKAGLLPGDIITHIENTSLKDKTLVELINSTRVGESVSITVWRKGETKQMTAILSTNSQ